MEQIMESLLDWLGLCPLLGGEEGGCGLGQQEGWTLFDCGQEVEALYWDGGRRRKHSFSLELRLPVSCEEERREASKTIQKVLDWILEQEELELYPELGEGQEVVQLEVSSSGLSSIDEDGVYASAQLPLVLHIEEGGGAFGTEN